MRAYVAHFQQVNIYLLALMLTLGSRDCTPKGHFFKKFDKRVRVDFFQKCLPTDIKNRQ